MRSPSEGLRRAGNVLLGLLLASGAAAAAPTDLATPALPASASSAASSASGAAPLTVEQVRSAVAEMRADPDFVGVRIERRLRLKDSEQPERKPAQTPGWWRDFARWLSEAGRGAVWLVGAVLVAVFVVSVWRWVSVKGDAVRARAAVRPSHVNDLDIRPESLPDDIAGAARALWQRGEHRAALSLLYRGALSRLVHEFGVTIRAASTEGECLALAQGALPAAGGEFFERLVRAWQTEVYAGRSADDAAGLALCAGFDQHFASRSPGATAAGGPPRPATSAGASA